MINNMARLFTGGLMLGVLAAAVGCSSGGHAFVVDTLYQASSGDRIDCSAEIMGKDCRGKERPAPAPVTTWHRPGEPDRVLTVKGSLGPTQAPRVLEPRQLDADHVVLMEAGKPVASFDYDHARAFLGAADQPAWTKGEAGGGGGTAR